MTPMQEIHMERHRQIEVEGWTIEHDDAHADGEMLRAAVLYYLHAAKPEFFPSLRPDGAPLGWPWEARWWKPKDPHRDLIRAGALCLAERERLRRTKRTIHWTDASTPYVGHVEQKLSQIVDAIDRLPGNQ